MNITKCLNSHTLGRKNRPVPRRSKKTNKNNTEPTITINIGDFKAKIGKTKEDSEIKKGSYGLGT